MWKINVAFRVLTGFEVSVTVTMPRVQWFFPISKNPNTPKEVFTSKKSHSLLEQAEYARTNNSTSKRKKWLSITHVHGPLRSANVFTVITSLVYYLNCVYVLTRLPLGVLWPSVFGPCNYYVRKSARELSIHYWVYWV